MDILELIGVTKRFGSKEVLRGVSLTVPERCVFGFVGRNGAGKTTAMKCVLGLLKPDGGEIEVCGERVRYGGTRTNRFVGYLPDVPEFYGYMTAPEYLTLCGRVTGMPSAAIRERTAELLGLVGLKDERHRIGGYSRGMKQRLGIAQALINRPRLLICDEPTSALDPVGRREILDILAAAKEQTSVLFSTHILTDVERICDHVAFLEGGRIAIEGTIDEIKGLRADTAVEILPEKTADLARLREAFPDTAVQDGKLIAANASDETARALLRFLVEQEIPVLRFERQEPTLEDLFMEVVGQ